MSKSALFEQLDDVKEKDMEYIREKAEHIAEKREEIDALLNTHTKGWKTKSYEQSRLKHPACCSL